jgi:16S rRNA (guanine(966)-N(2))-methyltransferase RsmD
MRVISGSLRGRKLLPPKGKELRPTADRAKETLFNILCSRYSLNDAKVLELFCGSGALGIECISRGAEEAVFVDVNIELAGKNADALGITDSCRLVRSEVMKYLDKTADKYDYIFADPPYDFREYNELIRKMLSLTDVAVLEHSGKFDPKEMFEDRIVVSRKAGKAHLTIFDNRNQLT